MVNFGKFRTEVTKIDRTRPKSTKSVPGVPFQFNSDNKKMHCGSYLLLLNLTISGRYYCFSLLEFGPNNSFKDSWDFSPAVLFILS